MCTRACVHICVPNMFCSHLLGTLYPVVTLCSRDGATSPVVCMRLLGMSAFMVAEVWARGLVSREDNDKKKEHQHAQSDALLGSRGVNPSLFLAIFP